MNVQAINNLLNQAEKLPIDERLLLIERLVESIRRVSVSASKPKSRWANIAKRVHEDKRYGGWSEQLKRDMREFRDNFVFKQA